MFYFSNTFRQKIFRSKMILWKMKITRYNVVYYGWFGVWVDWVDWVENCLMPKKCPNKCPFWPLRVEVLKREFQNIKKHGCDHYALISRFRHQKYVTDFLGGSRWVGAAGGGGWRWVAAMCLFSRFFVSQYNTKRPTPHPIEWHTHANLVLTKQQISEIMTVIFWRRSISTAVI